MEYSNLYVISDQPTACPKCGNRTEFTFDLPDTLEKMQYHKCLTVNCRYKFIVEEDN